MDGFPLVRCHFGDVSSNLELYAIAYLTVGFLPLASCLFFVLRIGAGDLNLWQFRDNYSKFSTLLLFYC